MNVISALRWFIDRFRNVYRRGCNLVKPQIVVNTQLVCDSILIYSYYGQEAGFNA